MDGPYRIILEQPDAGFTLGTGIAAVAALLAFITLLAQGRRLRRQLGHEDMWKLIDRWDGEELRKARAETARHMLANWERRDELTDPALELLDTFARFPRRPVENSLPGCCVDQLLRSGYSMVARLSPWNREIPRGRPNHLRGFHPRMKICRRSYRGRFLRKTRLPA